MAGLYARLKHAFNVFQNPDVVEPDVVYSPAASHGRRPDMPFFRVSNERSIVASIYTRLSVDVAQTNIRHVRLDDSGRYVEDIDSALNNCLTVEANIDQAARQFRQDIAMTLFDRGVLAIVPVDTTSMLNETGSFDIKTMRVGYITGWYPTHVKVSVYRDSTGAREDVVVPKKAVAIVENPLYSVMNEPNSTLQRLIRKLNLLDAVDEQAASGKLDIIIQLPYVIKSEAKREAAEQRRAEIEFQLKGSQYGIAYADATEKITQLNRPAENNLLKSVEFLTNMLYDQLGITNEIMNGTADEKAMLNYYNRTIEPVVSAIVEAMRRSFITKTARSQKQDLVFFRDPFKLVPINEIAEIADKFTRNEILTSNEVRAIVGFKPVKDKKADQLINSNMPTEKAKPAVDPTTVKPDGTEPSSPIPKGDSQNGT